MKIGPYDPNRPIATGLENKSRKQPESKQQSETGKDSVRISGDARRLAEAGRNDEAKKAVRKADTGAKTDDNNIDDNIIGSNGRIVSGNALDSEKLSEIKAKIKTGFYERGDIKEQIANRLADALNT